MKSPTKLAAIVAGLPPTLVDRTFARRVRLASLLRLKGPPSAALSVPLPDFLWASTTAGRLNPPGIESLYLGEGEIVAAAETKQHPGLAGFDTAPAGPDTVYHVVVRATAILDITPADVQLAIGTDEAELLAPWRLASPDAPTQVLGKAVYDSGRFEGIRYRSAPLAKAGVEAYCVVLFRGRKLPTSIVQLYDVSGFFAGHW